MSLVKTVLIKSVGVPASFHTVTNVTLNKGVNNASINVASYYNKDVYAAGANPLSQSTVVVAALPDDGQDVWKFADEFLAKDAPAGADTSAVLEQFAAVNPFVFAGAAIV